MAVSSYLRTIGSYFSVSGDIVDSTEKLSITDGAFWAIYTSMTTPFLVPLIIVILGNNAPVGYMVGLPVLLVPLAQILSQKASRRASDLKALTIAITFFDRLLWVPIIFMVFVHGYFDRFFLLVLFLSLRAFFASFSGTTWTLWVPTVVPAGHRISYFARRNFVMKIFSLVGYALALGIFLRISDEITALLVVFLTGSILFSSLSLYVMARIPSFSLSTDDRNERKPIDSGFSRYMLFAVVWSIGYTMVLPYFQLYVVSANFLNQSGTFYTILFVVLSAASISSQLFWGKFSGRYGNMPAILISGVMSAVASLAIFTISSPLAIFVPTIVYGVAQSGITLAMFNEMVGKAASSRVKSVSYYALTQSLAGAVGPIFANFLFDIGRYRVEPVFIAAFSLMGVSLVILIAVNRLKITDFNSHA